MLEGKSFCRIHTALEFRNTLPETVPPEIDIRDAVSDAKEQVEAFMVEGGHPVPAVAASTSPFNIDHAYGSKNDAIEYVTQLQMPELMKLCASCKWVASHMKLRWKQSGNTENM